MDAIAEWTAAYERVCELVGGLGDEDAARAVPACPDWTVRDLLSHMIGLDADVVAGDEPDDHNSTWTQKHVDERAGRSIAELLDEWAAVATPLRGWMRANTTRPLGDIVVHEQDLRGALGIPGAKDTLGMRALRDRMLGRFAQAVDGLPAIALVSAEWEWCSSGEVGQAEVELRAELFELTRALMSRRSAAQLRSWTTRGDLEPFLPAFSGLGALPATELSE